MILHRFLKVLGNSENSESLNQSLDSTSVGRTNGFKDRRTSRRAESGLRFYINMWSKRNDFALVFKSRKVAFPLGFHGPQDHLLRRPRGGPGAQNLVTNLTEKGSLGPLRIHGPPGD